MKKFLSIALSAVCCVSFLAGCETNREEPAETTYKVTFVQSGVENIVREVRSGNALTNIPVPQAQKGYSVVWEDVDFENITKDITVNAIATPNTYTITYQLAEDEIMEGELTQDVTYDATYELKMPVKALHTFSAWTTETQTLPQSGVWTIDADVTLTATWELNVWTVTFVQAGEEDIVKTVEKGAALTDIPTPKAKEGYSVAWNVTDFSAITENMTVTAVETAEKYNVTYEVAADESLEGGATQEVTFGENYKLLKPTKEGYTFVGWKNKATGLIVPEEGKWSIANNVTLVAEWTASENEVTFVHWDGTKETREVLTGETLTDIPTPKAKEGYTVAWNRTDFSGITGATTVTAIPTANEYEVAYQLKEGETMENSDADNVTFDAAYTLKTPVRYGYTFVGWSYEEGKTLTASGDKWSIAKDVTLTAVWSDNFYTLTFVQAGCGNVVITLENGDTLAVTDIPDVQIKKGYTVKWNVTDFSAITENTTITAVETANEYTVNYVLKANETVEGDASMKVTFGQAYTLATPKKSGYEFKYWKIALTGEKVEQSGTYLWDNDLRLEAHFVQEETGEWTKNY